MAPSTPLLIVIAGPGRGQSVPLHGSLSIGRDEQNVLPIADRGLSRHHCVIEVSGSQYLLKDLGSKNGVFVNGLPVTERSLADGDQIRVGDSALVAMIPGRRVASDAGGHSVILDKTPVPTSSTISIDAASCRYLDLDQAGARGSGRATKDLEVLFRLSEALQCVATVDGLHELLLAHALEASGAEGAAIITTPSGDDALAIVGAKAAHDQPMTVCAAIAAQALADRAAVLASDIPALCVPLLGSDGAHSVLCLTARSGGAGFSKDDLRLQAAIGSIGGLALERINHLEWLHGENARLRQDAAIEHNIVGESAPMQAVYRFIARVAATDATVLVRGESGTGKELVAHAIHANSARAHGPFVAINCAALPDALLESELFGHERGAFTGAISQQRGRLELADHGTVFLDEIGELAPSLQAKLLRVLQDQIVERVGARRGIKIDVRVIAATNRDLESAIVQGGFRKDLYYRLNVVSLEIPPLRERRDDLPLLAAYYVRKHASRCKRPVRGISPVARSLLMGYDWPGNVRELSNAIERAVVLGSSDMILPEDLPEVLLESHCPEVNPEGFHARVAESKRQLIAEALQRHGGNVAATARELGLQPTYLHRLIKNLNAPRPAESPRPQRLL